MYMSMKTIWCVVIRDLRDAQSDEPLSEATFYDSLQMRAFLTRYMQENGDAVTEYWIYRDGVEHEHVSF